MLLLRHRAASQPGLQKPLKAGKALDLPSPVRNQTDEPVLNRPDGIGQQVQGDITYAPKMSDAWLPCSADAGGSSFCRQTAEKTDKTASPVCAQT